MFLMVLCEVELGRVWVTLALRAAPLPSCPVEGFLMVCLLVPASVMSAWRRGVFENVEQCGEIFQITVIITQESTFHTIE